MKIKKMHLMEILKEYKEDVLYLILLGIPSGIISILIDPFMDYAHLY